MNAKTPWLLAVALSLAAAASCKTSTGTPPPTSSGDDDSGTSCPCVLSDKTNTMVNIACGTEGCIDGLQFLCSQGVATQEGPCDVGDGAILPEACVPNCPPNACNMGDQCGGECTCPSGVPCVGGQCGANACVGVTDQYCDMPEAGPMGCCATGYACSTTTGRCCVATMGAECATAADCCQSSNNCVAIHNDAGAVIAHQCI